MNEVNDKTLSNSVKAIKEGKPYKDLLALFSTGTIVSFAIGVFGHALFGFAGLFLIGALYFGYCWLGNVKKESDTVFE